MGQDLRGVQRDSQLHAQPQGDVWEAHPKVSSHHTLVDSQRGGCRIFKWDFQVSASHKSGGNSLTC